MEVLHFWNDFSVLFALLGELLKSAVSGITKPVSYAYNFAGSFVTNATGEVTATTTPTIQEHFGTSTMSIFKTLPFWNTLTTILGVAILVLTGLAIIKLLTRI